MSSLLAMLPSALASTNPGMGAFTYGVPNPSDSYASQFMPLSPTTPNNVIRDPTMGSLISLSTLSDTAEVLTLPDVIVFSTINKSDSSLYTVVMPVVNMKNLTTFRFTVRDFPQVPINQVSELGVPRYLHNRKWTSQTSLTRWAIGNRYSMEYLRHPAGMQQQIADRTQIAVSFAATLDLIVLDSLKSAHRPLRMKLEEFGKYSFTDVAEAMEWQRFNFAALQKREHGWSLFLQNAKRKMQSYDGNASALIVDKSIALLFPQRAELIEFYRSGMPAAPRVNNPERLMSENTPVDKILFTDFKPAAVGAILSPMQHIVQIGNWFISQDLPMHTANQRYAEVYTTQCREIQIYDQDLDSFVTLKLKDLVRHSDIFGHDGEFKTEVFQDEKGHHRRTDFIGDFFGSKDGDFDDNSRSSMNIMVESLVHKISKMGNVSADALDAWLEGGLRVYEKMSREFDTVFLTSIIRWSAVTGSTAAVDKDTDVPTIFDTNNAKKRSNIDFYTDETTERLVDRETSFLKMNRDDNNMFSLPKFQSMVNESVAAFKPFPFDIHKRPPSSFCGYLSWDGFSQIHDYYEGLASDKKAESEGDWLAVYNFVEGIKLIVRYWKNNLSQCGLFDNVKGTFAALRKSAEESLVDQVFNFNATFQLYTNYHKLGMFFKDVGHGHVTASQVGGKVKGLLNKVENNTAETIGKLKPAQDLPNTSFGGSNQTLLASIYDRLVAESFAAMLNTIHKKCKDNDNYRNAKTFGQIKSMLRYKPTGGIFLRCAPDIDARGVDNQKKYKLTESVDIDVDALCSDRNMNQTLKSNLATLSTVHWALVGEWVLHVYELALYAIYQAINKSVESKKITEFIDAVDGLFKKKPFKFAATDLNSVEAVTFKNGNFDPAFDVDGNGTEYNTVKSLADLALSKDTVANLKTALQGVWFLPDNKKADAIIDEKIKTLNDEITKLIGTIKSWENEDIIYKPVGPNAEQIKRGEIPLLKYTPWSKSFTIDENALNVDLTDTFNSTNNVGYTVTLAKELRVTVDDKSPGHLPGADDTVFFGKREKTSIPDWRNEFQEVVNNNNKSTTRSFGTFDAKSAIWVRTPFKLSVEQVTTLYGKLATMGVSELDFRVSDPGNHMDESIVHEHKASLIPSKIKKNLLYMDHDTLKQRVQSAQAADDGVIDSNQLPFVDARLKCRFVVDGYSLKFSVGRQGPRKHVYDDLFGYRLNLNEDDIGRLTKKIVPFTKHNRSPLRIAVSMLVFTTRLNAVNSEALIEQGIIYPIDFIVWRLWANYVASLAFLVDPGVQNLGFVAIACADHRSGQTPMTKEGMFNSSVWAGGVMMKPENTMTLMNAAITSFGHGGGSGYMTDEQANDLDFRTNYRRPGLGETSASLLVSAIPKGTCPKRSAISVTGRLPEGDYQSSGLQLSATEKAMGPHYETCYYYGKKWSLKGSASHAKSLAEALGPDGTTLTTNIIAYKGTTLYWSPFFNKYNLMTVNTGHFGVEEGPGCKAARLNGTVFPDFGYLKDRNITLVD